MKSRSTLTALAAFTFTALALAACTSQVGGQAGPSTTTSATAAPSDTPSSDPANPFAGLSPCPLLDQALAGQGFPTAAPTTADAKRTCAAQRPRAGDTEGVDVALSLQNGQKIDENVNNPGKASTGTVNERPATEEREPLNSTGQCSIKIQVKPDSRALLLVTYSSDTEKACQSAEDIAAKVEPLLPKTS